MTGAAEAGGSAAERTVAGVIPGRPSAFVDRGDQLAVLREAQGGSGSCVVHVVTGTRGVGKTQLAAAYARECAAAGWRLVAWINASCHAQMLAGLAEAAAALGVPVGEDHEATARALRHRLESDGRRCLLVFDDPVDLARLAAYLPTAGRTRIVITSTALSATSLGTPIPVGVFSLGQAASYLAERTGLEDDGAARAVAGELGCLPLALAQAGGVIAAQRIGYRICLDRLRAMPVARYLAPAADDPLSQASPTYKRFNEALMKGAKALVGGYDVVINPLDQFMRTADWFIVECKKRMPAGSAQS